jgi:hypothetical protein
MNTIYQISDGMMSALDIFPVMGDHPCYGVKGVIKEQEIIAVAHKDINQDMYLSVFDVESCEVVACREVGSIDNAYVLLRYLEAAEMDVHALQECKLDIVLE